MQNSPVTMMTINELAAQTGLAKHFIRQLALQNKVVHVRAGKKILINYARFIDYLNTGEQCQSEAVGKIRQLG